jgi:hypothetical protein
VRWARSETLRVCFQPACVTASVAGIFGGDLSSVVVDRELYTVLHATAVDRADGESVPLPLLRVRPTGPGIPRGVVVDPGGVEVFTDGHALASGRRFTSWPFSMTTILPWLRCTWSTMVWASSLAGAPHEFSVTPS